MGLTTTKALKAFLGSSACDDSNQDLQTLIDQASAVIQEYTGRDFISGLKVEFYDGTGHPDIALRQRPVTQIASVWLGEGAYGDAEAAFPVETQLVNGLDYALVRDGEAKGKSGLLRRLGGSSWAWDVFPGDEPYPTWPEGRGNIKVVYVAGFATIPADIVLATHQLAAWIRQTAEHGGRELQSETLGDYSYTLGSGGGATVATGLGVGLPPMVRQILSRYREVAI